MINLFNLKNQLIGYGALLGGLLLAIFKIRKGGRDAERQENTQATLEAVKQKQEVENDYLSNADVNRKRLRAKWTRK